MALTTKEQLKQVLDAVFNNGNPDTEYVNNANTPSIKMYLNEMKKNATILEREENINKYLVAILQTENHPYLNKGEVEYFSCKDIKDALLTTVDDLKEYNRGVSSYIPMKQYIRNIGAFLGVSISPNFDELQPVYYQDMVNIVKKYCTLNNKGLAYWGRYDVSGTATYRSYVPIMCLVDIAIYLNDLGVFSNDSIIYQFNHIIGNYGKDNPEKVFIKLSKYYDNLSLKEYKEFLNNWLDITFSQEYKEIVSLMIDALVTIYGNELNFDDNIYLFHCINSPSATNVIYRLYEYPKNILVCNTYNNYASSNLSYMRNTRLNSSNYSVCIFKSEEDISLSVYEVSYNKTTLEVATNKTITSYLADTEFQLPCVGVWSINCNTYLRPYYTRNNNFPNNFRTNSNLPNGSNSDYVFIDNFSGLSGGTYYEDLKYLSKDEVLSLKGASLTFYISKLLLSDNIDFNNNDFAFYTYIYSSRYIYKLVIVKNIAGIDFTNVSSSPSIAVEVTGRLNYTCCKHPNSNYTELENPYLNDTSFSTDKTYDFRTTHDIEIYTLESDYTITKETLSSSDIVINRSFFNVSSGSINLVALNIGEYVKKSQSGNLDGLETIPSSIYPKQVVDLPSFITTYSGATYRTISNPYYENDELIVTNLHTDTWVACNVTKNIPVDQNTAQNPNVDDLTDDEIKDVLKDIDNSTDDKDDEDDPLSEDETKPGENEGDSTIPTIDDVFKYSMSQFQTQWVLNDAEFQALGLLINSTDFLNVIALKIAGILGIDPLSGIVSVQVAPISLTPNIDTTLKTMVIRGIEMSGDVNFLDTGTKTVTVQGYTLTENVKEFDLGEKDISNYFNSYMDLVDTQMTLYLPFIGNIDLDIRDFYDGSIWIKGFVESFTGQIVYYIIAKKENQTRIISTVTGNCYSTIPLNQDSYGSIMNSFTRG